MTKAVTATLAGIALNKGFIKDTGQPVLDFFTDHRIANLDERKKAMTVEHLLSMRDGLQCVSSPSEITLMQMIFSPNWVQFMFVVYVNGIGNNMDMEITLNFKENRLVGKMDITVVGEIPIRGESIK